LNDVPSYSMSPVQSITMVVWPGSCHLAAAAIPGQHLISLNCRRAITYLADNRFIFRIQYSGHLLIRQEVAKYSFGLIFLMFLSFVVTSVSPASIRLQTRVRALDHHEVLPVEPVSFPSVNWFMLEVLSQRAIIFKLVYDVYCRTGLWTFFAEAHLF
jgi:hypothetical protein